jgi:hypothetical protein
MMDSCKGGKAIEQRNSVIPAQAGIQHIICGADAPRWIPAFAGMTTLEIIE